MQSVTLMLCLTAAEPARFKLELEPCWVRNDLVRYYGIEDTFLFRGRLEARTELYPGANLYARLRWQPPLSEYSRGYLLLAEEALAVQGAYIEFLPGAGELKLGVVEFPVGTDDELFLDKGVVEPLLRERIPRFDVGALYSAGGERWKLDLALVNGEGGAYADANSGRPVAGRISALLGPLEVGLSGAQGSRHSTPVKEEDDYYGVFACLEKGKLTARAEVMCIDWDFRAEYLDPGDVMEDLQEEFHFGPEAYARLEEYVIRQYYAWGAKHSLGWYLRLDWQASERLLLFLHGGQWDPDVETESSEYAQVKTRVGAGGQYRLRSGEDHASWFEIFLSWTDEPTVAPERILYPIDWVLAMRIEKRF